MSTQVRALSKKRLEIVVPGEYNSRYTGGEAPRKIVINNARWFGGGADYAERLLYSAKCAIAEQGWELTDKPLYVGIIIYRKLPYLVSKQLKGKKKMETKRMLVATKKPSLENVYRQHVFTLRDVVFKSPTQITASFLLRLFDDDNPRTEIIFGQPENLKELLHDIRNL